MVMVTKNKKFGLFAIAVGAVGLLLIASTSFAASYILTASVPYEVPTQASIIDTPGVTVSDSSIAIAGTCTVITPSAIVSLWNGGSLLGATTCQLDGTFSVVVHLQPGLNTVVPKTSNIANVYGPQGSPILFTYNAPPPPVVEPVNPVTNPANTSTAVTAENVPVATPALQVSSPQPFGILSNIGQVTIDITVQGGDTPYDIVVKWGDGKSDSKSVSEPGTYTFSHIYKQKNSYTAAVRVKDSKGNSTDILIPFSDVKGAIAKRVVSESPTPIIEGSTVTLSVLAIAAVLSLTAIGTFFLGHLHQKHLHRKATLKKGKIIGAKKRRRR
jgi:hypothetical protein